jgi:hypothetical protein
LYSSSNIIRQIKSRRMRWAGHLARVGEERKVYTVLVRKPEKRDHTKDRGVDGKMGSEWILERWAESGWSGFTWIRTGIGGGLS